MPRIPADPRQIFLERIHQRPKRFLHEWIGVPAHIHHMAYRMTNPPQSGTTLAKSLNSF